MNNYKLHEIRQSFEIKTDPLKFIYSDLCMDHSKKKKCDTQMETSDILYCYEEDGIIYYFHRITLKKVLMMKGKEVICACAIKKLEDGRIMEVSKSYDEPLYEIGEN